VYPIPAHSAKPTVKLTNPLRPRELYILYNHRTSVVETLRDTGTDLIVVHPDFLDEVTEAAGIPPHRILLLDKPKSPGGDLSYPILWKLVSDFEDSREHFTERKLADGSAIPKLAFYLISYGLSGVSKVYYQLPQPA